MYLLYFKACQSTFSKSTEQKGIVLRVSIVIYIKKTETDSHELADLYDSNYFFHERIQSKVLLH